MSNCSVTSHRRCPWRCRVHGTTGVRLSEDGQVATGTDCALAAARPPVSGGLARSTVHIYGILGMHAITCTQDRVRPARQAPRGDALLHTRTLPRVPGNLSVGDGCLAAGEPLSPHLWGMGAVVSTCMQGRRGAPQLAPQPRKLVRSARGYGRRRGRRTRALEREQHSPLYLQFGTSRRVTKQSPLRLEPLGE